MMGPSGAEGADADLCDGDGGGTHWWSGGDEADVCDGNDGADGSESGAGAEATRPTCATEAKAAGPLVLQVGRRRKDDSGAGAKGVKMGLSGAEADEGREGGGADACKKSGREWSRKVRKGGEGTELGK